MQSYTAFLYGTLMHPKILKRVLSNDGSHLEICPAVLLDYTRHIVKYAEYPGLVSYRRAKKLFSRELSQEERSVRGTLVRGLTRMDIESLDLFEGDEYEREIIQAHPLTPFIDISTFGEDDSSLIPAHLPPLPEVSAFLPPIEAQTYVYLYDYNLEPQLWSLEDFVKKNAWKWYGSAADKSDENEDITEEDCLEDLSLNPWQDKRTAPFKESS